MSATFGSFPPLKLRDLRTKNTYSSNHGLLVSTSMGAPQSAKGCSIAPISLAAVVEFTTCIATSAMNQRRAWRKRLSHHLNRLSGRSNPSLRSEDVQSMTFQNWAHHFCTAGHWQAGRSNLKHQILCSQCPNTLRWPKLLKQPNVGMAQLQAEPQALAATGEPGHFPQEDGVPKPSEFWEELQPPKRGHEPHPQGEACLNPHILTPNIP